MGIRTGGYPSRSGCRSTRRKAADFVSRWIDKRKGSYATYEAAQKAGLVIKKEHPKLQVEVYDGVESLNKLIEMP